MKSIVIGLTALIFLSGSTSCSTSKSLSTTGNWSKSDIKLMDDELKKVDAELEALGNKKQSFIDCYKAKVVNSYQNFNDANKDLEGCEKLAMECANDLIK